jgi:hypothetical protein
MPGKIRHDQVGNATVRCPAADLGGPEGEPAAGRPGQLPKDAHRTRLQVDVAAAQRRQLGPPQAAEDREQDHGAVSRVDRVGQGEHLAEGEHRPLG